MSERVLIPVDGAPQSWEAFEHALGQFDDAELIVLTAIDPLDAGYGGQGPLWTTGEEWYEQQKSGAEELFAEARERAGERAEALTTVTEVGRPARAIVEYVEEHDVDHVVMGSHGRSGVARILLGSVAETVVRRSPVPVTVVR
jgi:nucleotide-binding universal stress UspA family protein